MSASRYYREYASFLIKDGEDLLFTILADGTIERGPHFTTTDEMSLKFWEAIENARRYGPLGKEDAESEEQ